MDPTENIHRLSPPGCKVLFDWGLETELREHAVVGEGFMLYQCESCLQLLLIYAKTKGSIDNPKEGHSGGGCFGSSSCPSPRMTESLIYAGRNLWDAELLKEARGDFLQMRVCIFCLSRKHIN